MEKREAVERLVSRMYKHHLKNTGRLPSGTEVRGMENRAAVVAERADKKAELGGGR